MLKQSWVMELNAYLTSNGQCEEAFKFYELCLRGKIEMMVTHGDSPWRNRPLQNCVQGILHTRLTVGNAVLMGSDAPPQFFSQPQGFSVSISVESTDEAERIFKELADGGTVRVPLQETFWAKRLGMLIDRFSNPRMVNCEQPA
jgi:PhnB protein